MNLLDPVQNIMSTDLLVLPPSASMQEAGELFKGKKIHHIPVVYAGELVGILSKTDFLHFEHPYVETEAEKEKEKQRLQHVKVSEMMTKGIAKLAPEDRINVALEIFKANRFHAIPVVDHTRLVGILTPLDIIKHLDADKSVTNSY